MKVALTEPELPSLTTGGVAIESDGPSSSSIVAVPTPSMTLPSLAPPMLTTKLSSTSSSPSSKVSTVNVSAGGAGRDLEDPPAGCLVVGPACRAVFGLPADLLHGVAGAVQGDRERGRSALVDGHVVDRPRERVVVVDRAQAERVEQDHVDRAKEVDVEGLVRLVERLADHVDGVGLGQRRAVGVEGERLDRARDVVLRGKSACRRRSLTGS